MEENGGKSFWSDIAPEELKRTRTVTENTTNHLVSFVRERLKFDDENVRPADATAIACCHFYEEYQRYYRQKEGSLAGYSQPSDAEVKSAFETAEGNFRVETGVNCCPGCFRKATAKCGCLTQKRRKLKVFVGVDIPL